MMKMSLQPSNVKKKTSRKSALNMYTTPKYLEKLFQIDPLISFIASRFTHSFFCEYVHKKKTKEGKKSAIKKKKLAAVYNFEKGQIFDLYLFIFFFSRHFFFSA